MNKLIIDTTRHRLVEGRTNGISHALVLRDKTTYTEIMPLSPCKDYLSDAIWAERTKKKSDKIYGFDHTPTNILAKKFIYLSTAKCSDDKNSEPTKYDLTKHLTLINAIEKSLGVKLTKVIETNHYPVLKIDKYWSQYPYLISMYGLFWREGFNYENNLDVWLNTKVGYEGIGDRAINNYKFLTTNKPPLQKWDRTINSIHKEGIATVNLQIMHDYENQANPEV